jgi:Fe-S-cluster-containing hydrogenase component 2
VQACPFGALTFDVEKGKVIKCDLCNGEPKCAEFCPVGAIKYTTVTKAILERRASSVIRFGELIKKLVEQEILRI